MPDAFKHQDGITVPLVWQHGHSEPTNVLGHAVLENRGDGVYAYGYFNDTDAGRAAKALVQHKDITMLSIYANRLVEKSKQVFHGMIKEVSLVLSGANPGALIDNVTLAHGDGELETLEDEAIIYTGLTLEHEDRGNAGGEESDENDELEHEVDSGATVQDVYDSLTQEQKDVVHFMIGTALEEAMATQHDDMNDQNDTDNSSDEGDLEHKEGTDEMGTKRNVFEQQKQDEDGGYVLTHSDIQAIMTDAQAKGSLKAAAEDFALAHGITDIDILFPDAKSVTDTPEFDKRRTEWVSGVLSGTRHSPFSRIKTFSADITMDEARAKGYIKGTLKKEEFFSVAKRETTPKTIYKKQKLDRDDIIDITDFDVVRWMKGEMRLMLDEELARAILISDGRDVADEDKINEANIRPIASEHELYATQVYVNIDDASSSMTEVVDAIIAARRWYKGTGTPTFYTTETYLTKMLLLRDGFGRRIYRNVGELADELRVASIVTVEPMEEVADLVGIVVNLQDYVVGADRGGEVSMFEDFDIDYNQQKYLIETRVSGALVKLKAALVIRKVASTDVLTVPVAPTFDEGTGTGGSLTFPADTHVVYTIGATTYDSTDNPVAVAAGTTVTVQATPATGYYFETSAQDSWSFTAL
jgi:hypothetical protein